MDKNMKEYQVIVDMGDNVIGSKERGTLTAKDIYRVSSIWIFNEKDELLIVNCEKT